MSQIVDTEFGRFRTVGDGKKKWWLWECPKCKSWAGMSSDQMDGKVSVVCSGPEGQGACDYHETHPFGRTLVATMQSLILMGYKPVHDEGESRWQPSRAGGVDGPIGTI